MRKRDLGILLIAAFAVFISLQHETNFSFREAFYHIGGDPRIPEGHKTISPIVFDLNGDGRKEIIYASTDARIQVVQPIVPPVGESYHSARTMKEVTLMPRKLQVAEDDHTAVAMAVGYLDPPPSRRKTSSSLSSSSSSSLSGSKTIGVARRKAVVVVLTNSWLLMCFNHNLELMWEISIEHHFPSTAVIDEVALLVSNHTMHKGDRGVVIVGASAESDLMHESEDVHREEEEERGEAEHEQAAGEKDNLEDVTEGGAGVNERHFSYYAFNGATGDLRWKHDSMDFHRDMSALSQKLIPQHNYKLDVGALNSRHFGELECRDFKESVLQAMPHRWEGPHDTHLSLANFRRHRRRLHKRLPGRRHGHASEHHGPPVRHLAGKDHHSNVAARVLGKAVDLAGHTRKKKGHDEHAHGNASAHHWWARNAIVAHFREGIEVIHLYSGRTICKLHLLENELHVDVNGDGVMDHVKATGLDSERDVSIAHEEGRSVLNPCWGVVTSGIPPSHHLLDGSVCLNHHFSFLHLNDVAFSTMEEGGEQERERVAVVTPILVPRPDWQRRMGRGKNIATHHGDIIFLNSKGEMTSYASESLRKKKVSDGQHGHLRWQISTGAHWHPPADSEDNREEDPWGGVAHTYAHLSAMALRAGGREEVILAVGDGEAVFVSPGGRVLASIATPLPPTGPVIVADFNGDRMNDIIVPTHVGLYGFVQVRQPGAMVLSSLVGCVVIIIAVAFVALHLNAPKGKPKGYDRRSTD